MPPVSPCVGLCRLHPASGLCLGCARTGDEVAAWATMAPAMLERVWAALPERRRRLGLGMHRLGWSARDARAFIRDSLRGGGGTWVAGVHGAVAEFRVGEGEAVDVAADGTTAATARGALGFHVPDEVRALAFGDAAAAPEEAIVVLALPRHLVPGPAPRGLTRCGADRDALRADERHHLLYDFGLGGVAGRFGVRTAEAGLLDVLDRALGLPWPALLGAAGAALLAASPTRVVRHPLGRVEVYTPIPPPDGASTAGPHTHLIPDALRLGGDLPPELSIPDALVACAVHHPARSAAIAAGHGARDPAA